MQRNDKKQTELDDNLIDEIIRMSYGFSEEQIQAEIEDAIAHPDNSPELKAPDDEFQQILKKMEERGITLLPLEGESKADAHMDSADNTVFHEKGGIAGKRKISLRRMRKILLAAAVLAVAGIGFSLNAVGKGATKYKVINGEKTNIIWSNVKVVEGIDNSSEAYSQIEEKLDIPSVRIGYMPEKMTFEDLVLSENYGVIRFICNGKYLQVYELQIGAQTHGILGSDKREKVEEIYNPWLKVDMEIYEENLENGIKKYSVDIKTDSAYYVICGEIDREEFFQIAEGLYIDN